MPIHIQYLLQTIFDYAMIFSLAYLVLLLMERLRKTGNGRMQWMAGLCIGLILLMINWVLSAYGFGGAPDGRFLLTAYTTFFYGIPAGVMVAFFSATAASALHGLSFLQIFLTTSIQVIAFGFLRKQWQRDKRVLKMWHIVGSAFVALVLALPFAVNQIPDKEILAQIVTYIPMLSFIATIAMVGISVATLRELERTQNIEALMVNKQEMTHQVMEIQALYEEMAATEETLRENYDELVVYKEKVEFYAFHDSKTGFYNRDYLVETVNQLKTKNTNRSAALIVVGIKHMDHYREILGSTVIEVMAYYVGLDIKSCFEALAENQIYSLGDGRFAVLITEWQDKDEIDEAAGCLQKALDKSIMIESLELSIQIAFGGIWMDAEGALVDRYLEYAEIAFLSAADQEFSKAIQWFEKPLYEKRALKQKMEQHLRKAVELDEFYLVLQPQVGSEHDVRGFEALIRWRNSELGMVSPSDFIPLAEDMGYIDVIGRLVIEKACQKIKWLKDEQLSQAPVSINVSFIELMSPHYVELLIETLGRYGLAHSDMCLEITESMISLVYEDVTQNIEALIRSGFDLHLDDFGTGYSSLNHLGRFPVKVLKIDKSFVDVILTDEKMRVLVEMVIEYAHRLKMEVIAEGVEREEQVVLLKELGCDSYQGYYYARPMSDEALLSWLLEQSDHQKTT